jgi:diguanylate cyclase (GGDEF)-like protein/PAS domain S-box-containing protein
MAPSLRPEHLLAAILSSAEDALLGFTLDGTIHIWSKGAERLYGYRQGEMVGQSAMKLLLSDEVQNYQELLACLREQRASSIEFRDRLHKSGSKIRVALTYGVARNENGEIVGVLESGRRANKASRCDEVPFCSLLEQMPAFLWTMDNNLRIISNWGSGMRLAKINPGELIGRSAYDLLECDAVRPEELRQYEPALRETPSCFEFRLRNRDFEIRLEPLRDASGKVVGCVGAGIDITERKRDEEQYRYQATHDALTTLANYREFLDALEREVPRAERTNHSFALMLLDVDDLKRINDRWGHLSGNRALKRLADVLKEHCRATDVAARYGGDEFAVLLIDADPGMAQQITRRVQNALDKDREEPRVRVSVGISVYPDNGRSARELLQAADEQLYRHKKERRGRMLSAP